MKVFKFALVTFSLIGLVACGGGNKNAGAPQNLQNVDYPEWVMKGGGAYGGEDGRVFYGVGMVSGVKNPGFARDAADTKARADLGKIFGTYTASLMKMYMASTTAGDMSASSEEQHMEQAIKSFSAQDLAGVTIAHRWVHPTDGSWYALARLDMEGFGNNLEKIKELTSEVRDYVRKNAEKAQMDLEKEEAARATP